MTNRNNKEIEAWKIRTMANDMIKVSTKSTFWIMMDLLTFFNIDESNGDEIYNTVEVLRSVK